MAIRWVSTPESIKANQPSVLAIVETLAAMTVSIWIAVTWNTYLHIAIGALIAPLLLMRTDESCIQGVEIARKLRDSLKLFVVYSSEQSRSRYEMLLPIKLLLALIGMPMLFFVARMAAWIVTLVRQPLVSLAAIPCNWRYATATLDSKKWPDILLAPRNAPESLYAGICHDIGTLIKKFSEISSSEKGCLGWSLWIVCMPLLVVPAFAYRWSLKSTAIIWFPLLWAIRSVSMAGKSFRTCLSIYLLDPITKIALWASIAFTTGFAIKIVLFNEFTSFVDWWNATPLRRVLSIYVAPGELQWWQVVMVINSAIAITMYILACRWLVRIEHEVLSDEALPRRLFLIGMFIRPLLSCYTIACTLYITVRVAFDLQWPALGTKLFPWM